MDVQHIMSASPRHVTACASVSPSQPHSAITHRCLLFLDVILPSSYHPPLSFGTEVEVVIHRHVGTLDFFTTTGPDTTEETGERFFDE